jgi:hypothetical protein
MWNLYNFEEEIILRGENVKPDKNWSKRPTYAKQELMKINWHAIGGKWGRKTNLS